MGTGSLLINVDIGETRVGLIEDGAVREFYVERKRERSPVGNVYLGRVTRVLPGMQAAFIDIGLERAAFLHVEDLAAAPELQDEDGKPSKDEDAQPVTTKSGRNRASRKTPIRDLLNEGQELMVQVVKSQLGTKGARVTTHVTLPGRYVVYMPDVDYVSVSKRIGNDQERARLKEVVEAIKPPKGGIIVRTLAHGLTKKMLKNDIGYLVHVWQKTEEARKEKKGKVPSTLYEEPDIVVRTARDLFTEDVKEIVIDDRDEYKRLRDFLEIFMPERLNDVKLFEGHEPLFDEYGIENEITRSLGRRLHLPSGGYIVFDQTEALTAIDVNTGRFTGKGKDVEQTILQTNLEAAKEIAYQLRLRNIGGLIVLDFIDMENRGHRERVFRELMEFLKKDRARTSAARMSELGLIEMTRKRSRESLSRALYEACFFCDGTGHLQSKTTVCHEIMRQLKREKDSLPGYGITINAHPSICDTLEREERALLEEAGRRFQRRIVLNPRSDYHLEQFDLAGN